MTVAAFTLSGSSAAGLAYDVVCKVDAQTVTRAVSAALALYPVVGLLQAAANPGTACQVVLDGFVPPSLTGLPALAGKGRVNGTTARVERVASLGPSDYPVGDIDASGYLDLQVDPISVGTRAEVEALTTPRHNAYVYCAEALGPFSFNALSSATANGTTVLAADDGTRGRWLYTPFQSDAAFVASFGRYIQPDGNLDQLAELQAAIDDASAEWAADGIKREVVIGPGVLRVATLPHMKSGVVLSGYRGRSTVKAHSTWVPDIAFADDRTNCLLAGDGVENSAKLNTTLTNSITPGGATYYGAGARKLSLASLGTLAVNDYFKVVGHETAVGETPGGSNGSAVESNELLQVAALQTSPNRVTLAWPTRAYHDVDAGGVGTPRSVRAVDPLRDFEIRDLTFDCSGGTFAVAIRLDSALRGIIDGCAFKGFSRSPIEVFGCLDIYMDGVLLNGENNGGVYVRASHCIDIHGLRTSTTGLRNHANGLRRATIFTEWNPSVTVADSTIRHVVQGMSFRGGKAEVCRVTIDDCDIRPQSLSDGIHGTLRGVGIDTGNGEGPNDEYVKAINLTDVIVSNCRSDSATSNSNDQFEWSVCFHDCHQVRATGLSVLNNGLAGSTTLDGDDDYQMYGIGFQDCYATLTNCVVKGCEYGYGVRFSLGVTLENCKYVSAPGSGAQSQIALWLNDGKALSINNFDGGGGAYLWFTTAFASNTPELPEFSGVTTFVDVKVQGPFLVAKNGTGGGVTHGDVVALDPASAAGQRSFITPAGGSTHHAVVCFFTNGTYWLVKALPGAATFANVSGAIAVGDYIEAQNGSRVAIKGTVANARTIGRALEAKGAGTAIIKLQPHTYLS